MKRKKRDKVSRAISSGRLAGIRGHSEDTCPYAQLDKRGAWLGGWREGRAMYLEGCIKYTRDVA